MIQPFDDAYFMKRALQQAETAFDKGEVPVGAIIVFKNQIIARAHNLTETLNDVTAHAEMQAFTAAADFLGGKYLKDCELYVTLEPCQMCAGASYWTQIGKIVYGASEPERGFRNLKTTLHPKTKVVSGILENECSQLLKRFFVEKRNLNHFTMNFRISADEQTSASRIVAIVEKWIAFVFLNFKVDKFAEVMPKFHPIFYFRISV